MKSIKPFYGLLFTAVMAATISVLFSLPFIPVAAVLIGLSAFLPKQVALMSVVQNTLIGQSRQRIGNAVFSTWKGINVLKSKPMSVANPKTDGQVQQRSAFSQLVLGFRNMPAVVRAGFKKLAVKKSEFNAFMSYNLKNAFDYSTPPTATIQPANVLISKGTIAETPITTAVADRSSNTIVVTFPSTTDQPGQSATDQALVAAYNVTKNDFYGEVTTDPRSGGTGTIDLPADWSTGDTLRIYLGFSNPLSKETSDSTNVAGAIVA